MRILDTWRAAEPVRLYLYGVGLAVLLLLVGYGLIGGDQAALWSGLLVALVLAPAVEKARSTVTPPASLPDAAGRPGSDPVAGTDVHE